MIDGNCNQKMKQNRRESRYAGSAFSSRTTKNGHSARKHVMQLFVTVHMAIVHVSV